MFHTLTAACRLILGGGLIGNYSADPEEGESPKYPRTSYICTVVFAKKPNRSLKAAQNPHGSNTGFEPGTLGALRFDSRITGGTDLKAYATETATRSKGRRIEMFFWKKRKRRGNGR